MVTLQSAENALKTVYLGVLSDQLNYSVNPFMAKIEQTSSDVWGKEIRKLAPYGANGGVGASDEDGDLPKAGGNNYAQFILKLKNFFGKIEISDKAIRASSSNSGAFVNLLNAEMDGLLKNAKSNFGRMLFGDGSGVLTYCEDIVVGNKKQVIVESSKNLLEGMIVDFGNLDEESIQTNNAGYRIVSVDHTNRILTFDKNVEIEGIDNYAIFTQNSLNSELTGLKAIFKSDTLYGLERNKYSFLKPYEKSAMGKFSTSVMQEAIDYVEEFAGSNVNMIITSYAVKRAYLDFMSLNRTNVDFMNLDGGFKALTYNGIPVVADRYCGEKDMFILNSNDFKMHQLCDWRWLEGERGNILKQVANKPVYTATLVKYADMICDRPAGQAKLTNLIK